MVIASGIDSQAGRATIFAFDLATGGALWDFDLPDAHGLYPDRGAMALSEDGMLYAATLDGSVLAMDAVRGTRRWEAKVAGAVYGGVSLAGDWLLVPAGDELCVLDRSDGRTPADAAGGDAAGHRARRLGEAGYVAGDDHRLHAFDLATGADSVDGRDGRAVRRRPARPRSDGLRGDDGRHGLRL